MPLKKASTRRRLVRVDTGDLVPLEARLQPPVVQDRVVLRGELVDMLREHDDVPVVVVTGPPGYGKTTLLVQWAGEDSRPFTWLTVDRGANDPVVFATYLLLALQRLGEVEPDALEALADRDTVAQVLLPRLAGIVAGQERPFVLVVDDAGSLSSRSAVNVLMTVITHLPAGSQLVLSGRTIPHLPLSKLRVERRLLALGPDDLRFSAAEAGAVLAAADVEPTESNVTALLSHTEGWPAAVYLSSLSLRRAARQRADVGRFDVRDEVVAGYLRETVFSALSLDEQRFLSRTAILSRLSGPLCDAVLARSGSADLLRDLARRNLFVLPDDAQENWYRCHGMFQQMLRQTLTGQDARIIAMLHARASRWFEAAGDMEEAIDHAQAAAEVARAARLIWSQAAPLLASGRSRTLARWLDGFTNEQVVGHAKLALTAAWCGLETGHPAQHWITAAERGVFDATQPGEEGSVRAAIGLLHAYTGQGGVAGLRADAESAAELQAADDLWRPFTEYLQAVAILLAGHLDEAAGRFAATERLAAELDLPAHRALCLAQLAALAIEAGDWDEAAARSDAASEALAERGVGDSPVISLVHCVATVLLAKRGQTDEARRLGRRCMRMIAVVNQCPPWLGIQARYLLGRAQLMLGDSVAARVLFSEAHSLMHSTLDAVWLRGCLDEAWAHVEKYPLTTGVRPSALTSAELRVLQLLPTHLSFEQIGKRLFISRHTVKTQAIATYRKLGVSSRGEAVERARSLGMIEG